MSRELALPFAIDPVSGGVAYTTDPLQQIANHIISVLGTSHNERAMNPSYGAGIARYQFEDLADPLTVAQMRDDMTRTLRILCPEADIVAVDVTQSVEDRAAAVVSVSFRPAGAALMQPVRTQVTLAMFSSSGTVEETL